MDGNLSNSAVSGLEMSFTSGASSTYLETDNFGGSLYVPYVNGSKLGVSGSSSSADSFTVTNSAGHAFTIDLSDDFPYNPLEPVTFQWRQYINGQLSTPTIENTKYKYRYTHYLSFARCMFPSFSISGSADSSVLTNPAYSSTSEGDGDFSFHYSSSTNSAIGGFDFTATTSSSFVTSSSFATYGVWNDYCLVVEPGTPYLEQANRGNYNRDYLIFPFSYSVWVNGIRVLSVSSMARLLIQYSSSSLDKISTLGNFYSGYPDSFMAH